ncbi:MAG TPA: hypothetical protein VFA07_09275 [Chthonomonadaceae bacterium]|nr:hypothetical protein [Chthonomonadaceae bacterium]
MTVNERLFVAGLIEAFDAAVRQRDKTKMVALLEQVALSPGQAKWTAETILADPSKYGY